MRNKWMKSLICILLVCSLVVPYTYENHSAFATNADADLQVAAEILYLRDGPGLSYPVLATLQEGQKLMFIEKQDDWYHVKTGDMEGWVASWLTKSLDSSSSETKSTLPSSVISQVDHLNVRTEPSLSSSVLTQLNTGDEAKVLAIDMNWIQISFGGITGWVSADYVTAKQIETDQPIQSSEDAPLEETSVEIDPNLFTITVEAVNIRKKADLSSKKLGTLKKGEQYEVLERENNWVKLQIGKKEGWVYSFYGTFQVNDTIPASGDSEKTQENDNPSVTIIYNGTNLREEPSTSSNIVVRANAGESYKMVAAENDWYEVEVAQNTTAYVANWVVSLDEDGQPKTAENKKEPKKETRKPGTLKGLTIVIDPGHGGNDKGTTGVRGTDEKEINLKTVELLKSKLRSAGAEVILTRESDVYVDLRKRVSISHQYAADAFISIHYDAIDDSTVSGFTTYYTHGFQSELAQYVHAGIADKVTLRDRGAQAGNYLVTRENKRAAILIELGYLSNPTEESIVTTDYYREQATLGIYEGLLNYFDAQLEE
ncbi:N-acetylmuramoyl-L-alanine amidase [Lysinibacillus yapensis]|uniref:N-acetylmuramoyl-L-alanine amidase n=1 Tax=Ureibacillus yapensis TaxID=2304605 RepID=A0A396SBB4_9BACL|nr:SH3 domain-containing protein [Lysinibacillus yapensis]RHW38651.1 N-acetylmuramoyl-L-alanine amidase [Lysinibacillus yapensis]